jgi:biopolymer transport protein ExbB
MNERHTALLCRRLGWLVLAAATVYLAATSLAVSQAAEPAEPGAKAAPAAAPDAGADAGVISTTNVAKIMEQGGVLMWPLALCSVIGMAFVLERFVSLRPSRVIPKAFVTRMLQQVRDGDLDRDAALALCEENKSPVAVVFAGAIRKWGRSSVEVEQGLIDAGERATNGLRRYLRVFTALTVISPLMGLLGTVFGMIRTFNVVAETTVARGDPQILAGGISQALLNTAFGLIIAIPAQSFYYYFVSRVDRLIIQMDTYGQDLVNTISAEELQNRSESRPSRVRRKTEV